MFFSGYALLSREPHQPGKVPGFYSPDLGRREGALPRHQDQGPTKKPICAKSLLACVKLFFLCECLASSLQGNTPKYGGLTFTSCTMCSKRDQFQWHLFVKKAASTVSRCED